MSLHKSLRIYPSGNVTYNTVLDEHLEGHIEYNRKFRFGCSLIVDGNLVVKCEIRNLTELENEWLSKFDTLRFSDKCTAPYN